VSTYDDLTLRMGDVARSLPREGEPQDTLESAVRLALEVVDGCDEVGVSLVRRNKRVETPVATGPAARLGDELQYQLGEGPCLDAVWVHSLVHSPDLARDARWPRWAPAATEATGMRSLMSFQLFTAGHTVGALNLYSRSTSAYTPMDEHVGTALAAHVAGALGSAVKVEQLSEAVPRRTMIGQAQGILMERFGIDADRAFQVMVRVSQQRNVKLHEIAAEVVTTRKTPR
jgi:GAF domain-containing protein